MNVFRRLSLDKKKLDYTLTIRCRETGLWLRHDYFKLENRKNILSLHTFKQEIEINRKWETRGLVNIYKMVNKVEKKDT